jgi:hypothetical protein
MGWVGREWAALFVWFGPLLEQSCLIRLLTPRFLAQHIKNWAARLIDCLGGKNVFVCLFVCLYSSSVGAVEEKFSASFGWNGEVWCLREGKLILLDRCGSCSRKRKKSKRCLLSGGGGVAWIELN